MQERRGREREHSLASRKKVDKYSYNLNQRIGKGYSSVVYKGRNDLTNQPIALKVIDLKGVKDGVARQMLDSEIVLLKELKHPNLLRLVQVLKTNNHCYLVTELCQGDLASVLKEKGRLPENQAMAYFKDIVAGFSLLAESSVLHRDLKPANVFLSQNSCKIADFGFAKKNTSPGQRQRYNVGSPLYMSPQSLKRNVYSTKNDIWALGVILFEMLFGRTPWECRTQKELIQKITNVRVNFPGHPKISEEAKSLIERCLEVDEASRIGCSEIQAALKSYEDRAGDRAVLVSSMSERNQNRPFSQELGVKQIVAVGKENKDNERKALTAKDAAIHRINQCRLVFKLGEQLGQHNVLLPQLRLQLLRQISDLRSQDHTDRVRKVVEEYYSKYRTWTEGKEMHQVAGMEDKALGELRSTEGWARQLLCSYLLSRRGVSQGLADVLERKGSSSLSEIRARLQRVRLVL